MRRTIEVTSLLLVTVGAVALFGQRSKGPQASPRCQSAASCNVAGAAALNQGEALVAIQHFADEVGYAEIAQSKPEIVLAYNNLSIAYLHKHEYFRALAWIHLAQGVDPQSKATAHNLKVISDRVRNFTWPRQVTGAYVQYAGQAYWNSLCVNQVNEQEIDFELLVYVVSGAGREFSPNSIGNVEGKAVLDSRGYAQYSESLYGEVPPCHVSMSFKSGAVEIKQEGECLFKHGLTVEGLFERIAAAPMPGGECGACDAAGLPETPATGATKERGETVSGTVSFEGKRW